VTLKARFALSTMTQRDEQERQWLEDLDKDALQSFKDGHPKTVMKSSMR
jgi:hypothetical protein